MTSTLLPEEDASARRQRRLLLLAWASTLLPLFAFGYLTWQSYEMSQSVAAARRQVDAARTELDGLNNEKARLQKEIQQSKLEANEQRESAKHYRDFAGIRIQFYRESDRATVEDALQKLGFQIDTKLGASRLINTDPNTIAHGSLVSEQDLRDIAVALVKAKFPLKRITKAVVQQDPKLIQIFASAASDRDCGLLTETLIQRGERCGPR